MYYTAFDDFNSDFGERNFFHKEKYVFCVSSGCLPRYFTTISGPGFVFDGRMEWTENPVPGQSVRYVEDRSHRTVATVTYLGGNLNLLQYMGEKYRIMHIGDAMAAFSENGTMVFCLKALRSIAGIPEYARKKLCWMEGYSYEMMVDEELPLPLQALLAASPSLCFYQKKR